jgi:hypothetical protein
MQHNDLRLYVILVCLIIVSIGLVSTSFPHETKMIVVVQEQPQIQFSTAATKEAAQLSSTESKHSLSSSSSSSLTQTPPSAKRFFAIVTISAKFSKSSGKEFAAQSRSAQFVNATIDAAFRNKLLYASLHKNYELIVGGDQSCTRNVIHPSFGKLKVVSNLLRQEKYDWILVVDHDAIFAQMDTSIETLLQTKIFSENDINNNNHNNIFSDQYDETARSKNMIIASDWNGVNTGVMLIRGKKSEWTKIFFRTLLNPPRECRHAGLFYEQSVLKCILDFPHAAPDRWRIQIVSPQRTINAYPPPYHFDHDESKFVQGEDFIAHFAGASGLATINSQKYPIEPAIEMFHKICKDSAAQSSAAAKAKAKVMKDLNVVDGFKFGDEGVFSFDDDNVRFERKNVC